MAKPLPRTLNLLTPAEKPVSTWDKIYHWVFTVGRYLIIAVELIVLLAFAGRFALDRMNNDLQEEISVKVRMLDAQQETEKELRRVQSTLNNLSKMTDDQDTMSDDIEEIFNDLPSEIDLDSFVMSQTTISITGVSPDYEIIEDFERDIRENSSYETPRLTVEKSGDEESEVEFELLIYFSEDAE